jgi:3'-5' exonuclease
VSYSATLLILRRFWRFVTCVTHVTSFFEDPRTKNFFSERKSRDRHGGTVPDLKGFAAANGHDGKSEDEVRVAMGDKFPKHIYHSIICIGALVAHREDGHWTVTALGAPHVRERPEKTLISAFVDRIAELSPQLVTFNGSSFDLPVLRYRALVHGVTAPGLSARPYFDRYTEDAVDLCDVLSSFNSQCKATLHELCRVMGLPGKPDGISGTDVERYYREGRIREIAE